MVEQVVVIGAGLYGAAVAAGLARRGAHVTVVDCGAPAGGTSSASFSWTNAGGKRPRTYREFAVASMDAHRRLAAAPHCDWYRETGNLQWATDETGRESLARKVADSLAYGYPVQWLDKAQVLALEPDINPALVPAEAIAYFPTEGWIEPTRLIGHLLSQAAGHNCRMVRGNAVIAMDVAGGMVRSVRLASGERLPVDAVVNCAGPQAAHVAALAGLHLPMRNTRGVVICTSPTTAWVTHVVHAPQLHLRPDGDGRLLLHTPHIDNAAEATDTGEIRVRPSAIDTVLADAQALYPALAGTRVESVRVGERPIPADGLPVLGRACELPNFSFAVSHSGATLSVHAGDLVASELLGHDHDDVLAPYRFERRAASNTR